MDTPKSNKEFDRVRSKLEIISSKVQAKAKIKAATTPVQLYLPGMIETMRAMPNHIARSSLFAPVGRGHKKLHHNTQLVSRSDAKLFYTGEQLDETQADVFMQVIYEAANHQLGIPFKINVVKFLKNMGRNTGSTQYEWLHRTLRILSSAVLYIEIYKLNRNGDNKLFFAETLDLLKFKYYGDLHLYEINIDPRWQSLYSSKEYALIDWTKRLEIARGQDMAKTLQRLIAASNDAVQRFALDWLKAKFVYASPMRKFKESLLAALRELERLAAIKSGKIEISTRGNEQLVICR